ncbi:MAG TPA: hypothetical protein ENK32_01820 [Anaerolineae bacterium]|nr:hypothetical protein [Anaerolineae bacterium]
MAGNNHTRIAQKLLAVGYAYEQTAQAQVAPNNEKLQQRPKSAWKRIAKWAGAILFLILLVIVLLSLIPVSTDGFESQPNPVTEYDEAVSRVEKIREEELPITC